MRCSDLWDEDVNSRWVVAREDIGDSSTDQLATFFLDQPRSKYESREYIRVDRNRRHPLDDLP
jgi:hypothetical protein